MIAQHVTQASIKIMINNASQKNNKLGLGGGGLAG